MVICYRLKGDRVERQIVSSRNSPRSRGEDRPPGHFSETILRAYYSQEIALGSRFRSSYRKSTIKKAHDDAIARAEAGLT